MNSNLLQHLHEFIGQTVTIFTTSGGPSGCGFTGVLLFVNPCYCRIMTQQGTPPANPLSESICGDQIGSNKHHKKPIYNAGSVCDIPVDRIASFCHNAI